MGRDGLELRPRVERTLLRPPTLGILDAVLGRIDVDHPPQDRPCKHLPKRLGGLKTVPRRDRHPPRRDLLRPQLAEPKVAERPDGLRKQPAQLLDRLRLPVVLTEILLDELPQRHRPRDAPLTSQPLERALERLPRILLRSEPAVLDPPRPAPADTATVRPQPPTIPTTRRQFEHLSLLQHMRSLLSSRPPQPGFSANCGSHGVLPGLCRQTGRFGSIDHSEKVASMLARKTEVLSESSPRSLAVPTPVVHSTSRAVIRLNLGQVVVPVSGAKAARGRPCQGHASRSASSLARCSSSAATSARSFFKSRSSRATSAITRRCRWPRSL